MPEGEPKSEAQYNGYSFPSSLGLITPDRLTRLLCHSVNRRQFLVGLTATSAALLVSCTKPAEPTVTPVNHPTSPDATLETERTETLRALAEMQTICQGFGLFGIGTPIILQLATGLETTLGTSRSAETALAATLWTTGHREALYAKSASWSPSLSAKIEKATSINNLELKKHYPVAYRLLSYWQSLVSGLVGESGTKAIVRNISIGAGGLVDMFAGGGTVASYMTTFGDFALSGEDTNTAPNLEDALHNDTTLLARIAASILHENTHLIVPIQSAVTPDQINQYGRRPTISDLAPAINSMRTQLAWHRVAASNELPILLDHLGIDERMKTGYGFLDSTAAQAMADALLALYRGTPDEATQAIIKSATFQRLICPDLAENNYRADREARIAIGDKLLDYISKNPKLFASTQLATSYDVNRWLFQLRHFEYVANIVESISRQTPPISLTKYPLFSRFLDHLFSIVVPELTFDKHLRLCRAGLQTIP